MKKIESIEDLKGIEDFQDYFIHFGIARSSKRIMHHKEDDTFTVHHEIDDTFEEDVTMEDLDKSNIGIAIQKGNFYSYD